MSKSALLMAASGLAVGWLVGMSVSPVIQGVIATLAAVITSAACVVPRRRRQPGAAPHQLPDPPPSPPVRVSPPMAASLSVTLAIGATLSVYVRTHEWLAPNPTQLIKRWTDAGFDNKYVVEHILNEPAFTNPEHVKAAVPGLFNTVPPKEYDVYRNISNDRLAQEMMASPNHNVSEFAKKCKDQPSCLRAAVDHLLSPAP
jgi:hypothetical protein